MIMHTQFLGKKMALANIKMFQEDKKSREAGEPEQLFYQDQVAI